MLTTTASRTVPTNHHTNVVCAVDIEITVMGFLSLESFFKRSTLLKRFEKGCEFTQTPSELKISQG